MVDGVKSAGEIIGREELPEREYTCEKHGKYRGKPVKFMLFGQVHDPICSQCLAEDEAKTAEEERKKAEKRKETERVNRLTGLNIGKIFWNESFETFNAYTPELRHHLAICVDFAKDHKGRKLVMLGNNGTGKNHLAASILKVTGGVIHTAYEIGVLIRQSYGSSNQEWEILKKLCSIPMLAIDEIEKAKATEAKNDWLSYVIGERYKNMLPSIFISNCHLMDNCNSAAKPCPKCLEYHFGNDIISRLNGTGLTLEFTGDDYRGIKRTNGLRSE